MIQQLRYDMWMDIIIYLTEHTNTTISALTIAIQGSYSHIFNILKILQSKDLITIKKDGRKNVVELTNKGWSAAGYIKNLQYVMEAKK